MDCSEIQHSKNVIGQCLRKLIIIIFTRLLNIVMDYTTLKGCVCVYTAIVVLIGPEGDLLSYSTLISLYLHKHSPNHTFLH